jgi:hypothetical protein
MLLLLQLWAPVTALEAVTGAKDHNPEEIQTSDAGDGSVVAANAESKCHENGGNTSNN